MGVQQLRNIERWNLVFSALAILIAALAFERPVLNGVAIGAAITCINFTGIRRIWEPVLSGNTSQSKTLQVLYIVKLLILAVVMFLCFTFVPMSGPAFAVGFSIFFLSIVVESARHALGRHAGAKP